MILSAILPLLIMQVGPNPAEQGLSELPIDPEGRRAAQSEQQQPQAATAIPERLRQCLLAVRDNPVSGENAARAWMQDADGTDAANARQCLGMAFYTQGQFADAMTVFLDARDRLPDTDNAARGRLSALAGNAGLASGEFEGALEALDMARIDAVALDDQQLLGETHIDRARALVGLSRNEDAADALSDAREALPDNATAWLLSATLSRRLERYANAQAQIERAATLAPQNPEIGLEAGVIAAVSGRYDEARLSFASVIEVAPDSAQAKRAQTYLDSLDDLSGTSASDTGIDAATQPDAAPSAQQPEGR